jgi:hypothetical protein
MERHPQYEKKKRLDGISLRTAESYFYTSMKLICTKRFWVIVQHVSNF